MVNRLYCNNMFVFKKMFLFVVLTSCIVHAQVLDKKTLFNKLKAVDSFSNTKDTVNLRRALNHLAAFYTEQANYAKSIEAHYKFLKLYPQNHQNFDQIGAHYNLAVNLSQTGKADEALHHAKKALNGYTDLRKVMPEMTEKINVAIGETYNVLAQVYSDKNEPDSSLKFSDMAEAVFTNTKQKALLANVVLNKGYLMLALEKYQEAFRLFDKAKLLFYEVKDSTGISSAYVNLCSAVFNSQTSPINAGALKTCLTYLDSAEKILNNKIASENLIRINYSRYLIYQEMRQYDKALLYYTQYAGIKDAMADQERTNSIENARITYELENEAEKNARLTTENQLLKAKTEKNNLLLLGGLALTLLIIVSIYSLFYRNKVKLEKRQQETEARALKLQMNPHFVFNAINSAQAFILENKTEEAHDYLADISKTVRHFLNYNTMKAISLYDEIEILRLYISIEEKRIKHKINFKIQNQTEFELSELLIPPALIQPLIENSIWHGFKNTLPGQEKIISLEITEGNNTLLIKVCDNGTGFSGNKSQHNSRGLDLIKERLIFYNNTPADIMQIEQTKGNTGVTISIKLPLNIKI